MRAALPALEEIAVAGWVIRASGGTTKRVNSANPTRPDARLADVLAPAERLYAARGLPPRFRLTPLADADADARLAVAGYARIDPSFTMLAPPPPAGTPDAAVVLGPPDRPWQQGHATASGWTAAQAVAHAAVLARLPAAAVAAMLVEAGRPLAYGVASVGGGRVQLFDIVVAAAARRRGHGRRLVAALLAWGAARGHDEAVLQVLADNDPARALYASLGFVDAFPYHYRIRR